MRRTGLLQLSVVLILSACKSDEVKTSPSEGRALLKASEPNYAVDTRVSVSLDSVRNDSRCPEDADCIWAGNAEVVFIFSDNQGELRFVLNTNPQFVTEQVIRGYRIKLITLTPYPMSTIVIKQSDYKTELSIKKE